MKTVMDAVNEFESDFNNPKLDTESHYDQLIVAMRDFDGYKVGQILTGSGNTAKGMYWKVIGTRKEFNDLVSQLETNFGRCDISFSEHCSNESVRVQKPKPVFTQAMADNGELPSVGMECLFSDSSGEVKVLIKYLSSWVIVFEQTKEGYGKGVELAKPIDDVKHLFKPIDTRTDKEKLQGEINAIWNNSADKWHTIDTIVNSLTGDKLTGVKWAGE